MDICTVREPNLASLSNQTVGDVLRRTEANKKEPQRLGSGDAVGVLTGGMQEEKHQELGIPIPLPVQTG